MSVICVRGNTSNRWKRNAKKKKQQAKQNKMQKKPKKNKKKTKTKTSKGYGRYGERVRAKWFCCAFKLAL